MNHTVTPNFSRHAEAFRRSFEEHAGDPDGHNQRHEVWDYWFVPNMYAYLRTDPQRVVPADLVQAFFEELRAWSIDTLGLGRVTWPRMALYVNGCGQGLHNDAFNGRYAYVLSLTPWASRTFSGGETILFRDQSYWGTEDILRPAAGEGLYELVPALFNQLLVFDDRVIHGVSPVQGQMGPCEGRLVLSGHISEDGIHVKGALPASDVESFWQERAPDLEERLEGFGPDYSGAVSLRLDIGPTGAVRECKLLLDGVRAIHAAEARASRISETIVGWARGLVFPAAAGESTVIAPFVLSSE